MTLTIDLHILQSVPPANLNRDDSGSPKTAVYGGVRRARVSSQAWKRVTRHDFSTRLNPDQVGVRTLRAAELLADRLQTLQPDIERDEALKAAKFALEAVGLKVVAKRAKKDAVEEDAGTKTEYLVFFSNQQLDGLAGLAAGGETDKKAYKAVLQGHNGIDLALFGRMVANDAELNVDASVQVAHALSTHAVENEFDFYTAVDDESPAEETGAGMMGTIEFNSSVLYRYATINVGLLDEQLSEHRDTVRGVTEFVRSFILSMPTGKQNTFANRTLPDAVLVTARLDRGVSFVGAFEEPVSAGPTGGHVRPSSEALAHYAKDEAIQFADAPAKAWVVRVGDRTEALDQLGARVTLPELLAEVEGYTSAELGLS
jgi:CRISPR system Cascade subunit CasC